MSRRNSRKPKGNYKASGNYEAKGAQNASKNESRDSKTSAASASKSSASSKAVTIPLKDEEGAKPRYEGRDSNDYVANRAGVVDAPKENDPSWYGMDQQLLIDSASFPYAYPFGQMFPLREDTVKVSDNEKLKITASESVLPGICSLVLKPTVGYAKDRLSPVNVAANAFYTHVRVANSGRKNYDPCDLMMFALTVADVYSFIFWCERLYNYAFTFSARNKYIGDALIKENGVDWQDIRLNLANFRYWINTYINKITAWAVPNDINLFKRRAFLYSNYYLENGFGNIKDQMYQYVPQCFMKFEYDEKGAGCLQPKNLHEFGSSNLLKVSDIISYGESLIENIYGDEDFAIMSGDIIKAYGSNIIGITPLGEDAGIAPSYDMFTLSQFKNADIAYTVEALHEASGLEVPTYEVPASTNPNDNKAVKYGGIYQDGYGNIRCQDIAIANISTANLDYADQLATPQLITTSNKVLSVENPTPGPADSIEASRLKIGNIELDEVLQVNMGGQRYANIINSGTEIVVAARFLTSNEFGHDQGRDHETIILNSNFLERARYYQVGDNYVYKGERMDEMLRIMMFKYAPLLYTFFTNIINVNNDVRIQILRVDSNVDNYTVLGSKEIAKMHECALLSLFYVPGIAKMVNYK